MGIDKMQPPRASAHERQSTHLESSTHPLTIVQLPDDFRARIVARIKTEHSDSFRGRPFRLGQLFMDPNIYRTRAEQNVRRAERGQTPLHPDLELAKECSEAIGQMYQAGFDGQDVDVLLRWVGADSTGDAERIAHNSETDGGTIDVHAEALNMSNGFGGDDQLFTSSIQSRGGVLFVYDGRKLRHLPVANAQSSNFTAGYGYIPQEGQTYRSALLGALIIK